MFRFIDVPNCRKHLESFESFFIGQSGDALFQSSGKISIAVFILALELFVNAVLPYTCQSSSLQDSPTTWSFGMTTI
jgi:hypothetical protein